ncbi:MAG: chorismate mutase [Tissierellales bacterium]|nr:chorismate mutase [Tissierellales bacterium]
MRTIRGAITIADNTENEIRENTITLLTQMMNQNQLLNHEVESIIFSVTKDITKAYPAKFARELNFPDTTFMCLQEMDVEGSLKMCIRVLMFINTPHHFPVSHVYLKKAAALRPDLAQKNQDVTL